MPEALPDSQLPDSQLPDSQLPDSQLPDSQPPDLAAEERAPEPGDSAADRLRGPTIYDVAKAAGVAASTVSRTFSRPGRVSSDTAERVRRVAMELGYWANPPTQASRAGRVSMVAFVISDVTNPFYAPIIRGAQHTAERHGFTMMLADTRESSQLERQVVERAMSMVDGVVLASPRMNESAIRMCAKVKPVIVLNRPTPGVPSVITDNGRGVRRAVEHLAQLGHDEITYLAGPEASWADGARWRALRETTLELDVRVRRIGPALPSVAGGAEAMLAFRERPTSVIIAYNDQMAIGAMGALMRAGVKVPGEVSVLGFDDIFAARLVTPPLTTVAAPLAAMGETAVTNLLGMISGATARSDQPVVLPVKLVVRSSTGPRMRHVGCGARGADSSARDGADR